MATKKELFNVKGVEMTAHEKIVFDKVVELARPVSYKEIAKECNISEKSACATLARLNATKGVLKKNEPIKVTTYEINEDID